ncbi:tyrosine-type recombinase/integrase [Methylocystis sp.]|uniref:tyrosine-type recombinase/integrase n=1 Tax=Methylocystis sp. TaxID=1911079 RepID=UPI003DA434DF
MSKKVSPLRQRMIDDMKMRNMALTTQSIYVSAVARFSAFHGRSPDTLGIEDVRDYRLHLISRNLNPNTINPIMGALRFFYGTTLGRKDITDQIPYARRADALPAVLSREEVERLLRATPNLKMRTAFITIYAAGLRVSELVALTAKDIDSARMVINVRHGKGDKDRYVMLSEQLLAILRDYWRRSRPSHWLFPGPNPLQPLTARSLQRACREAAEAAGLDKSVTVHTLRHSFATHLLEQRVDIRLIQDLLGHRNINTTTRYTRVALATIREIQSPLERLNVELTPPA